MIFAKFFKTIPLFFWFEVAAFLAATLSIKSIRKNYLIWFLPFLFFIVSVEVMGWYLPRVLHKHNAWIFNFSVPIEYLFYTFIFYRSLGSSRYKIVIRSLGVLYLLFCLMVLFLYNIKIFQNQILVVGNLLGIIYSCLFFYEILKKDVVVELLKEPMYWIACGVFLFNIGELTYTLFRPVLTANRWDVTLTIFKTINNRLIFWLYGCITIGLLCSRFKKMSN